MNRRAPVNHLSRGERQARWDAAAQEGRRNLGSPLVDKSARYIWQQCIADSDLPSTTKLVALTVALYGAADGSRIYPGIRDLARRTSLSQRATSVHVDGLVRGGWLARVPRRVGQDGCVGFVYQLHIPLGILDGESLRRFEHPDRGRRQSADGGSAGTADAGSARGGGADGGSAHGRAVRRVSDVGADPGAQGADSDAGGADPGAQGADGASTGVLTERQPSLPSSSPKSSPMSTPGECPPRRTARVDPTGQIREDSPEVQRRRREASRIVDELTARASR